MQQYYIVRQASDPKVIGVKNGASQARIERSEYNDPIEYDKLLNFFFTKYPSVNWDNVGKFPDFDINLESVLLEDKAKLTDFVSYYPNLRHGGNFLASEKVLDIIKDFNLPPHKVYNANLHSGERSISGYKLLYCPPLDYSVIDFNGTVFFTGSQLTGKELFKLKSGDEFEKKKKDSIFGVEKISFNDLFDRDFDYFLTRISIPAVFISQRLRDVFVNENVTGINITPASEPSID